MEKEARRESQKAGVIIGLIFGLVIALSLTPIISAIGVPGSSIIGFTGPSQIYNQVRSALMGPAFRVLVGLGLGASVGFIFGTFYTIPMGAIKMTLLNGLGGVVVGIVAGIVIGAIVGGVMGAFVAAFQVTGSTFIGLGVGANIGSRLGAVLGLITGGITGASLWSK
jgi:hypothetical protein